ncbi:MAG: hypothetical protein WDM85_02740 [Caulobacteraceae bacterium]
MKLRAFKQSTSALVGAAMMASAVAGVAQAQGLNDLVGMHTERAHRILASRGYQQTRMDPGSSGNRYFWWNGARAGCVAISGYMAGSRASMWRVRSSAASGAGLAGGHSGIPVQSIG